MKNLKDLLLDLVSKDVQDFEVEKVVNDSRKADETSLFITFSGYHGDLSDFILDAYEKGCRHFVVAKRPVDFLKDANYYIVDDIVSALALIGHRFYDFPSKKLYMVGVTGTNGKTTTTYTLYSAWKKLGKTAGLIGTIYYFIGDKKLEAHNTTPDVLEICDLLYQMVISGVTHVAMEVSSHALALGRVMNIDFDQMAFTNFSQDHLDFHETMENYLQAKLSSINLLASSEKPKKQFITNKDSFVFDKIKERADQFQDSIECYTFALENPNSDFFVTHFTSNLATTKFFMKENEFEIAMPGRPNVYNNALVVTLLSLQGFDYRDIKKSILDIRVPGRIEVFMSSRKFGIIVDYAHTPDAILNITESIKEWMTDGGRLILVFGAGGDRDRLKRPLMGKAACKYSDYLIVTSDNPRTEDPQQILKDIEKGITDVPYELEVMRKIAIEKALSMAKEKDMVVIAGKGHENYQIIGHEKKYFSDQAIVKENL